MKQKKRYFYTFTEEMIMNREYDGYFGGRIEVYDRKSESPYAVYEGRVFLPRECYSKFRECFDMLESDAGMMMKMNWAVRSKTELAKKGAKVGKSANNAS